MKACASDKEVIHFLSNCGEENLQFLLHPPRLQKALEILDTDKSGEVDREEWEEAINRGLAKRLQQLADERERRERDGSGGRRRIHRRVFERGACGPFAASNRTGFPRARVCLPLVLCRASLDLNAPSPCGIQHDRRRRERRPRKTGNCRGSQVESGRERGVLRPRELQLARTP